jgi:hypothetical protein
LTPSSSRTNATKKRVALVDFRLTGHHAFWLATYTNAFLGCNCDVDVYTSNIEECAEKMRASLPTLDLSRVRILFTKAAGMTSRVLGCRSYFRLRQLHADLQAQERLDFSNYDLVYFPYIDDIAQRDVVFPYFFGYPFPRVFAGLLMEPRLRVLEQRKGLYGKIEANCVTRPGANLVELGTLVEDVIVELNETMDCSVVQYPDFCSEVSCNIANDKVSQAIVKKKEQRTVTCLMGSIYPHKSLDLFIECVAASDAEKYLFVIAGKVWRDKFDSAISEFLDNPPENVIIFDGWIENEMIFDSILQLSDISFAHYREFRKSSGIMTKSAQYRKPIVVSEKYLMGERVRKYELGYALPEREIVELYRNDRLLDWKANDALITEFLEQHSVAKLDQNLSKLVAVLN